MILRRVIEHVKAQNWTAVALDFVIVVFGVFIGIQVSNWNEAAAENKRAVRNLERIHDDLMLDQHILSLRMAFWRKVYDYGREALAFAEGRRKGDEDAWALLLAFYQASQVSHFAKVDTTYEELKGAGQHGLIKDLGLRTEIARYYAGATRNLFMFRTLPAYRERVRAVTPFDVQVYIWENCHQSGSDEQDLLDCPSPIDEARANSILTTFLNDPVLINELRFWMTELRVTLDVGENTMGDVQKTALAIEESLP